MIQNPVMPQQADALQVSEILLLVLTILKDDRDNQFPHEPGRDTLANAIRVNKTWFKHGTSILWSDADPEHLLKIQDRSRQQLYASKITSLTFDFDFVSFEILDVLSELHFDALKNLEARGRSPVLDKAQVYELEM